MRRPTTTFVICLLCAAGAGCGDEEGPALVTGDYTISVTNGDDTCGLEDWDQGERVDGVSLEIGQDPSDRSLADATVSGAGSGLFLGVILGTNELEGMVSGNMVTLTANGVTPFRTGNCTFTVNATLEASVDDGVIDGTIVYTPADNGNSDCAPLAGCTSEQLFLGSR